MPPANAGSALNYNNDYNTYKTDLDYQLINTIATSGPAPMTTYGPGGWVVPFYPSYDANAVITSGSGDTIFDVSAGTRGVNQNIPGSSNYTTSAGVALFSQSNVSLNLQITISDSNSTHSFTSVYFFLTLSNPASCVWKPNSSVSAIGLVGVPFSSSTDANFDNSSQIPPYTTAYATGTTPISITDKTPIGGTYNVDITAATPTPGTDFYSYTGKVTIVPVNATTAAANADGTGNITAFLTQRLHSNEPIQPELNTVNSSIFYVTYTLPTKVTFNADYPLVINIPLIGYYTAPTFNTY